MLLCYFLCIFAQKKNSEYMIEYIKGEICGLNPAATIVETAGGVAYRLNITLPTFSALDGQKQVRLYVHESIREDAWTLYGFIDEQERELFRSLIGVSGVGAATAIIILSSLQGDELAAVITAGDAKRLKSIKGIGAKTAERIIVDLRDKIKASAPIAELSLSVSRRPAAYDEALAALVMLGFDRKASEKAIDKIFDAEPAIKVEAAIRKALSML